MSDRPNLKQLETVLAQPLARLFGGNGVGSITLLNSVAPADDPVPDAVTKWLICDARQRRVAVVLCASPVSPGLVARGMHRAREAKKALGPDLGRVILDSLQEGEILGLSYTVLPYCRPLSERRLIRRVQCGLLRPAVLDWLRNATKLTVREVSGTDAAEEFGKPLRHLSDHPELPDTLRSPAETAWERLKTGRWSPRHVLMHNDFWDGNILIDHRNVTGRGGRPWRNRFVIIDWPGASVRGYAFYDLLRFARATSWSIHRLHDEVAAHCRILGCELADAPCHLLAALGCLEMHRERFPLPHFIRTANGCLDTLWAVCGRWDSLGPRKTDQRAPAVAHQGLCGE